MEPVRETIGLIDWRWFAIAAVLFFLGMALGPAIYRRRIGWLLAYPRLLARFMERMLHRHRTFGPLFVRIFLINSVSILSDFLSGFGIFLPFLLIAWTGLNMALLASEMYGEAVPPARLLNFLALLELPAAWAMTSAGLQLGLAVAGYGDLSVSSALANGWQLFLLFSWPLLFVAAVVEAALIAIANRRSEIDGDGRLRSPENVIAPSDSSDPAHPE
jgi:hypothetical protein